MVWSMFFLLFSFFFKKIELKIMQMATVMLISKLYFMNLSQTEFLYFSLDFLSLSMSHLSIILSSFTLILYMKQEDRKKEFLCLLSGILAYFLFHSNNFMFFFIMFELSLIPLIVLIVGWGKQPERILAGQFILIYTFFSSFPLFFFMMFMEESVGLFSMTNPLLSSNYSVEMWPLSLNYLISLSFYLAFLVKVPIFFLHSWLPKAHVEASLEGSVILAGIMLKVGVYGIFRMMQMFSYSCVKMINGIIFCISIVGSVLSILMAVSSDDLKLSIALSSVSHMNFLLSSLMSFSSMTHSTANFVMISHGFISSILFFFVTVMYEVNFTRSMMIVKGSMSMFPSFLLITFLFFSLAVSLPPSLSFLGEMEMVVSIWSFSSKSTFFIIMFIIVNSFFMMMSYGMMAHSSKTKEYLSSEFEMIYNLIASFSFFLLILLFFFPEMVL